LYLAQRESPIAYGGKEKMNRNPLIAIGDIHGRPDLLGALIDDLRSEYTSFTVVFLGDYIDRGPDSAGVVEWMLSDYPGITKIALRGNHEEMMSRALADITSPYAAKWATLYGSVTLESYGWTPDDGYDLSMIPQAHREFISSRPLFLDDGTHFFVHAGIRPGTALTQQSTNDLLCIRDEFLTSTRDHGRIIVHGHSAYGDGPHIHANRINLDTGAYESHLLTAAAFEPGRAQPRIFQTNDLKETYERSLRR
jgi:serine/threonine protein phosphatase 1